MTFPKVSIVIPVYKAEPYIEKCVHSLFNQTLDNIEFIFVDDCSPDNSINVMKRVLSQYPNRTAQVKVVRHDINQGVAVARQSGVDVASGEYIIHCDPDDWVEFDMYETMYTEAKVKDADIVGCNFVQEYSSKQKIQRQSLNISKESIIHEILSGNIHCSLWCRLISRDLIDRIQAKFEAEITIMEDMLYVVPLHIAAGRVSDIPRSLYHYRMVEDSITHTFSLKHINSALTVTHRLKKYTIGNNKLYKAWELALCKNAQPLITQPDTYDPDKWRSETSCLSSPYFGSLKSRFSPWLVTHHLDALNLCVIKLYHFYNKWMDNLKINSTQTK